MNGLTWRTSMALAILVLLGSLKFSESDADPAPEVMTVNHPDMLNWVADGEQGLWIQAGNSKWFYARFADVCTGLQSINSLVFETGGSNRVDRTSSVILPGRRRCNVHSLVPSSGPPKNRNARVVLQPQTQ